MKKFYSALALAAAVTVSATAADVKKVSGLQKAAALDAQMVELQAEKPAKAPQKASTPAPMNIEELQGIYTAKLYCPFKGYDGVQTREYAILPGKDADHINIIGLANITIEAQVNYGGGIITIPGRTPVGPMQFSDGTFDCFFSHMHWNDAGDDILPMYEDPVIWVMLEDGMIECDDRRDLLMFEVGPGSGYVASYCGYAFELTKQVEPAGEDWVSVGDASFIDDGFYMPNWSFNKEGDPEITCELQRDNNNPSHLRLYNAYGNINKDVNAWLGVTNPADENYHIFNEENLPGSIQLNAEFPYCVAVPAGYLGLISDGSLWYGTNMEAGSLEGASDPEAQAQALLNALGADKLSYIDYEKKFAVIRNCEFKASFVNGYTSWASWLEEHNYEPSSDTVTIMLPENITEPSALGTITADENAPVEYFNLQGIRIDNPESGLYIRRQGNTVTKIVR